MIAPSRGLGVSGILMLPLATKMGGGEFKKREGDKYGVLRSP